MFIVDWVNVKTSWESSLWTVDEVTQLLSNKNLKETLGKNKLELSKLLEELNSLSFLTGDLGPSTAYDRGSSDQKISRPLFHSKLGYLWRFQGVKVSPKNTP